MSCRAQRVRQGRCWQRLSHLFELRARQRRGERRVRLSRHHAEGPQREGNHGLGAAQRRIRCASSVLLPFGEGRVGSVGRVRPMAITRRVMGFADAVSPLKRSARYRAAARRPSCPGRARGSCGIAVSWAIAFTKR